MSLMAYFDPLSAIMCVAKKLGGAGFADIGRASTQRLEAMYTALSLAIVAKHASGVKVCIDNYGLSIQPAGYEQRRLRSLSETSHTDLAYLERPMRLLTELYAHTEDPELQEDLCYIVAQAQVGIQRLVQTYADKAKENADKRAKYETVEKFMRLTNQPLSMFLAIQKQSSNLATSSSSSSSAAAKAAATETTTPMLRRQRLHKNTTPIATNEEISAATESLTVDVSARIVTGDIHDPPTEIEIKAAKIWSVEDIRTATLLLRMMNDPTESEAFQDACCAALQTKLAEKQNVCKTIFTSIR